MGQIDSFAITTLGIDKAIHHYAFDHYATWASEQGSLAAQLASGLNQFGENISTHDATKADICIGDIFHLGSQSSSIGKI